MMLNSSPLGSFRYHASRGVFPDAVNSQLGRAIWVDNQWYIIMGRTLFAIAGLSPPDGGTGGSDGSTMTPDAGTTPDAPAGTTPDAPAGTPSDAPAGTIPDAPGGTPPDAPAPIDASGAGGSANAPTQDSGCSVVLGTPTASSFSFFVVAVVLASRRYRRRSSHRT